MPHSLPTNPSDNPAPRVTRRPSPLAMSAVRAQDDDHTGGIEWKRVASALNRYKWLIAFITIAGTGGAAVATRFIKPQYSAQATVWIDETSRASNGADRGPIRQSQTFEPEAWLDLLRTYAVLDSVVHDLRLNVVFDPPLDSAATRSFAVAETFRTGQYQLRLSADGRAYSLVEKKRGVMELGATGDSIGKKLGFQWAPPASTFRGRSKVDFTVGTLRDAARALGEDLQAHIDPEGNFLKIELDGTDPARLTATLNDLAGRYVALAADLRHRKLGEVKGALESQRDIAHKSLTDAEQALEEFRQRNATQPRDAAPVTSALTPGGGAGPDPVAASYFDAQKELGSVKQERATLIKYSTGYASADLMVTDLERLPAVQKSSELSAALKELSTKEADLRALRYRYSDSYPAVQKLQDDIKELRQNTIPPMVGALAQQLGGREAELAGSASKTATDLRQIPQRSTDETRLRRNVALAENLYNSLQGRFDEAHVAEASAVADVRVLDQAVTPQRPVKNTAPRIIMIALIGSFGLAAMVAVLLDKADARFRYPNQVSETGLAILGVLPHVKSRHRGLDGLEDARLLEAVRAIRLNLTFAYGAAGPIVVTITSPGSGEGKSFLTSNLGRVFADGGRRTLVIDGDLRRGTLHRRLNLSRRPGLGDYLRGETSIDQAIRHTDNPNLDVITCGTRTHDAPELLGAQAMTQMLAQVRTRYDVVLCDSPPLGAGVDPFVLGAATGNLLLVLRTGVSHRELTGTKLGVLSRLPIRLLGTVLNDVPDDPVFGYYSYHLPGYEAHDERAVFSGEPKVLV